MMYWRFKKAATYSPTSAVPSALAGLTSLFGMGRGEPRRYNHLSFRIRCGHILSPFALSERKYLNILRKSLKKVREGNSHEFSILNYSNLKEFPPPLLLAEEVYISLRVISTTRL